jgi:DNA-binding SARP family transcriptional activator
VEFRLLGPLEVIDHRRALDLGPGKQRALLAILLLHANEVVSAARLIDDLWPEEAPRTATKSIQVYVSGLRKQLGEGRLVTRKPGYLLRVEPDELDGARFERIVSEAREAAPERAAARLREALALWRGPPLADLADAHFARPEIARLAGLRLAALEHRVDADLETGRHAELVGELEALVAEHPRRERPRRQLMLALYRCGRQAEALEVYHDARRTLVDELGIEPGAELRGLEQAILVQDRSLDRPPAQAEEPGSVFVGRERELSELLGALEDALSGRGRLVLLAGEPGSGKSRLADELALRASAHGARVLVGRCWEAGGAPAYWPWVQALRALDSGAAEADLAPLLSEIRQPSLVESEGARFRLFEAATVLLHAAASDRPLLLVLDDLHAADEASLLLLEFIARSIGDARMLVVGAYRDIDPAPRDALASAVAQILREPRTALITLAGLSPREIGAYVALAAAVEPAPRLADRIHERTEGNALFVVEAVRLLAADGRIADAAELRIPPALRAVIGQRVARLSERCRKLLDLASVIGREFGLDALRRLGDLPGDALLDVLDEAMAERVIEVAPGSPGRLRFGHELIRDAIYDDLTPARRLQLHRRAGEALEEVYAADPEAHMAELARHFLAAAPAGDAGKAIAYARRAGDRAASQLAYEEAARLYEEALSLVDDDVQRCELLLALGDALGRAGDVAASKRAFREAADVAERRGLDEELALAALGYGGRLMWDKARDDDEFVSLIERALAALGERDSELRVRLMIRLVCGPIAGGAYPWERRATLSRDALEMARRIGDPETLAFAIDGHIPVVESPANTRHLLEESTELLRIANDVGDLERVFEAHDHRLERLFELGEMGPASAELGAMARIAERLRQPTQNALVTACRARLALHEGRLDAAAELIAAGSAATGEGSDKLAFAFQLQRHLLERELGRLDAAAQLVRRSIDEYPDRPIWRCALAQLEAKLGHEDEARRALDALAADRFSGIPFDDSWLASMCFLAEAAALLGDAERAAVLYERLLPYADRVAVTYSEISLGSVARYLGLLAAATGRPSKADLHLDAAEKANRRIGAQPWLERSRRDRERLSRARAAAKRSAARP